MLLFERVRIVARQLAGSETKLAAQVGLPQRKLNGYFNETSQKNLWDLLPTILKKYPQVRRDWLYFGEGEMLEQGLDTISKSAAKPDEDGLAALKIRVGELEAELAEERRLNRQLTTRLLIDGVGDKGAATSIGKAGEGHE